MWHSWKSCIESELLKLLISLKAAPEEAQFKQVALWEACILQLAPKNIWVPDIDEISIIYLFIEKNGIEILLSLAIYFISK